MRLQKNIVFVGLMFTSAVLPAAEDILKNSGGQVSVLFTDINVFRRSLDSAPKIGGGNEDFRVQIACMGMKWSNPTGHLVKVVKLPIEVIYDKCQKEKEIYA